MYVSICVSHVCSGARCSLLLDTVSQRDDFSLIQACSLAASRPGNSLLFTLHSVVLINSQGFYVASGDSNSGPPVHAVSGPPPHQHSMFCFVLECFSEVETGVCKLLSLHTFQVSTTCSVYPASKPLWLRRPTWVFKPNKRWEPLRSTVLLSFVLWYLLQHRILETFNAPESCALIKLRLSQPLSALLPLAFSLHLFTCAHAYFMYVIMLFP